MDMTVLMRVWSKGIDSKGRKCFAEVAHGGGFQFLPGPATFPEAGNST
jgi:hypothetical protein